MRSAPPPVERCSNLRYMRAYGMAEASSLLNLEVGGEGGGIAKALLWLRLEIPLERDFNPSA